MRTFTLCCGLFVLASLGCTGKVKEEQITIKPVDPIAPVKATLQRYANGDPLGSEVTNFESLIAELRKVDADKADVAAKAFADIQKAPNNRIAVAKEALKKLG